MHRTAILNIVGLTPRLIGEYTPQIRAFMERNRSALIEPVLPAVTCTAQATYVTGRPPREHGAVANGWYDRDYAEHRFWKQPEQLVQGEKLWDMLRKHDPEFSCAKVFWWYNRCFTMWLAGGGAKPGLTHGETDDYCYSITRDPVHVHDLNATLLHLFGLDHTRLTYRFQGRDYRLTDVHGEVVKGVLE